MRSNRAAPLIALAGVAAVAAAWARGPAPVSAPAAEARRSAGGPEARVLPRRDDPHPRWILIAPQRWDGPTPVPGAWPKASTPPRCPRAGGERTDQGPLPAPAPNRGCGAPAP